MFRIIWTSGRDRVTILLGSILAKKIMSAETLTKAKVVESGPKLRIWSRKDSNKISELVYRIEEVRFNFFCFREVLVPRVWLHSWRIFEIYPPCIIEEP